MAHYLAGHDKYRDLLYGHEDRSFTRGAAAGYRFGRAHRGFRVLARSASRRINGYLRNIIVATAQAKLRRMERELELRGIHLDRHDNNRAQGPAGRSPGSNGSSQS
jgi:hypothetical protein